MNEDRQNPEAMGSASPVLFLVLLILFVIFCEAVRVRL